MSELGAEVLSRWGKKRFERGEDFDRQQTRWAVSLGWT